ncbi:MAG TPA: hypothetical protein VIM96_01405 [Pseudomonadales bacterium]|nr:hypothetical protein [Pseudomonadales bacterium]
MNILLDYLYRDAGNNKLWGNVIFSNHLNIELATLHEDVKNALIDGEFFVAEDVFLPSLRFDFPDNDLDHGWHEYFSVKGTSELSNDSLNRDISEFINGLTLSKMRNCY